MEKFDTNCALGGISDDGMIQPVLHEVQVARDIRVMIIRLLIIPKMY